LPLVWSSYLYYLSRFAPRLELCDELRCLERQDPTIHSLLDILKDLEAIVVERDDFKVLIGKWRGIFPEYDSHYDVDDGPMSDSTLLKLFDLLDYDTTGFVPRLDLLRSLQNKCLADCSIDSLVDLVKSKDQVIIEREDFMLLLNQRSHTHKPAPSVGGKGYIAPSVGGKGYIAPSVGKGPVVAAKSSGSSKLKLGDLMKIFDEVDEDGVGFAPRLDLRARVQVLPGTDHLCSTLRGLEKIILERDEFEVIVCDHYINFSGGSVEVEVEMPSIEVDVDVDVDVDIDVDVDVDIDVDVDVEVEVEMPSVEVEVEVEMPSIEIEVEMPSIEIEISGGFSL